MQKKLVIVVLLLLASFGLYAQDPARTVDPIGNVRSDTIAPAPYVNQGKIAARKAVIRSLILPGLGQIKNKVSVWSIGKVAAIYGSFAALTISYKDNTKYYNIFLEELQYRDANGGKSPPGSIYETYPTQGLYTAKDVYRRNREVIIFGYFGVYAINAIDAYVATRLKYFNVTEDITFRITPSMINSNTMYASQNVLAIKLSFKL